MEKRTPLIAGNWKMFKTCAQAVQTAQQLVNIVGNINNVDIMIAPPFTALESVYSIIKESTIAMGAQDMFWESQGAFTGQISAQMVVSAGCKYVIIGHSERRQYFNETNESVNKKIACALNNYLIPIMCIGESQQERESGKTFYVLDKQIKKGLQGFSYSQLESLIIAYEPVWAIGTGKTATTDQVQEVHQYIRNMIQNEFSNAFANSVRILYGGSVKPSNILALMEMPDVDGALVGGASLDAQTFGNIVQF